MSCRSQMTPISLFFLAITELGVLNLCRYELGAVCCSSHDIASEYVMGEVTYLGLEEQNRRGLYQQYKL